MKAKVTDTGKEQDGGLVEATTQPRKIKARYWLQTTLGEDPELQQGRKRTMTLAW